MNKHALYFALAVAAQFLILAAVPAQKIYTRATRRSVTLKIRPAEHVIRINGAYLERHAQLRNRQSRLVRRFGRWGGRRSSICRAQKASGRHMAPGLAVEILS